MLGLDVASLTHGISRRPTYRPAGRLLSCKDVLLKCSIQAAVGDHCHILVPGDKPILAEVIGFEVEITKGIKPGSGVGSSAASAVGAVVAANGCLVVAIGPCKELDGVAMNR